MDFKIITIMVLFIMANGKPMEESSHVKPAPAQSQSSSASSSSGLSEHPQPPSDISETDLYSIVGFSSNSAIEAIHTEDDTLSSNNPSPVLTSRNSFSEQKPHKVVSGDPVIGEFMGVECNPISELIIQHRNQSVESDFSASQLGDIPKLEDVSIGSVEHQFHSSSTSNLLSSNKFSAQTSTSSFGNRQKLDTGMVPANPATEEFDENEFSFASNDFGLIAQEQNDPVLSDFSASKLSGVIAAGTSTSKPQLESIVVPNGSGAELENSSSMSNKPKEEGEAAITSTSVNVEQLVTDATVITVKPSEASVVNNADTSNTQMSSEDSVDQNKITASSSQHDLAIANVTEAERAPSSEDSDNHIRGVLSGIQSQQINLTSQWKGSQTISGGASLSSSFVNGQEPITIVTAVHPDRENKPGSQVSSSSVTEKEPVTIVWASKPTISQFQNQPFGEANDPTGGHASSAGISVSTSSVTGQKPITVVSSPQLQNGQVSVSGISVSSSSINGQEPVTMVSAVHPNQMQNQAIDGQVSTAGISVSSSSVNGQKPVTVFSAFNPVTGLVSQIYNQQGNKSIADPISVESAVSGSSINAQKPVTIVSEPQLQNEEVSFTGVSVSSSSVNGQDPVTVVSAVNPIQMQNHHIEKPAVVVSAVNPTQVENQPVGGQVSSATASVSSISIKEHDPVKVSTTFNSMPELISQMQNQQTNKFTESPLLVGDPVSSSAINEQMPITMALTSAVEGQMQNQFTNVANKDTEGEASSPGITVSSSSVNGQEPTTLITATNQATATADEMQNQFNSVKSIPGEEVSVFSSSVTERKPVITLSGVNNPMGIFYQMQNQFFNRPMGGQMFPSFFGGFANQQQAVLNQIKDQLAGQQPNKPMGSEVSVGSSASSSPIHAPVTAINSQELENGQASFSGISVSSSSLNGQEPVTVVSIVKPIGSHIVAGSSASTGSIGGQKPMTIVSNSELQNGEVSFSGVSVSSSSVNGQDPVTVVSVVKPVGNHTVAGSSISTGSNGGQKPVTIVSNSELQNGEVSFSGVSVSSSSVNGQAPVTVVSAVNPIQMQNHDIGTQVVSEGISVSSSSINGKEPVTVVTAFKPVSGIISEIQNRQTNKSIGSQISVGSSASSGSINAPAISIQHLENGQQAFSGVSVSSTTVSGQGPITVVSAINPTQTQNHNIEGQVSSQGISVSSSSTNGQEPLIVLTALKPVSGIINQIQNQETNKPIGSEISVGSSVSSSSINEQKPVTVVSNHQLENGQVAFSGVSVSSSSVNGQDPVTVAGAASHTQMQNHAVGGHVSSEGISVSSSAINGQEPVQISVTFNPVSDIISQIQNQQVNKPIPNQIPVVSSVSSSSINGQKPVKVITNSPSQNGEVLFSGGSVSSSSVNGQESVVVVSATNPTHTPNQPIGGYVSSAGTSVSSTSTNGQTPVTVSTTFNPVLGLINQIQNQQVNKPIGSQISVGSSVSSSSINGQKPVAVITNSAVEGQIQSQFVNVANNSVGGEASSVGITVSSSSVNGQEPVTLITTINHTTSTENGSVGGISVSSSSVSEQKPVMISTSGNTHMGGLNQMQNQFFNRPLEGVSVSGSSVSEQKPAMPSVGVNNPMGVLNQMQNQFFNRPMGELSVSGSSVSEQKPAMPSVGVNNPMSVLNQMQNQFLNRPLEGVSVSGSSVSEQKPAMPSVGVNNPMSVLNQMQNQFLNRPLEGVSVSGSSVSEQKPAMPSVGVNNPMSVLNQMQNQFLNRPLEGVSVSGSSVSEQKPAMPSVGVNNPMSVLNQMQNQFFNRPLEGVSVSGSSVSEQKPAMPSVGVNNPMSVLNQMQNQFLNRPLEGVSVSGSSVSEQKPAMPSVGVNNPMGVLNQMQNQFLNRPMGGHMFPPFFGGSTNQQQHTSGFLNQIKDQLAMNMANGPTGQQTFVGSSIQSSSSSDGQKTQTTVTSTDSLTGKVTETKYQSSGGKPVAVFQTITTSVDGGKAHTVITSKNPITGEVSQTKYESSSVKNLLQGSDDSLDENVQLDMGIINNSTTHGVSQTGFSSSSTEETGKIIEETVKPKEPIKSEPAKSEITPIVEKTKSGSTTLGEKNSADIVTTASVGIMKPGGHNSLKEAVGLGIPNNAAGHISTGVIITSNSEIPVTVLTTKNPIIGASTQIKYITHPTHLMNTSPDVISQKVFMTSGTPLTPRSSSMNEITWTKRKYSIIDFNNPMEGGTGFSRLCNGQNSHPSATSKSSLTGKINLAKYKSSGVNVANVPPVNTRSSRNGVYPPAEPVSKRGKL